MEKCAFVFNSQNRFKMSEMPRRETLHYIGGI